MIHVVDYSCKRQCNIQWLVNKPVFIAAARVEVDFDKLYFTYPGIFGQGARETVTVQGDGITDLFTV
jgi:hypothetical protein